MQHNKHSLLFVRFLYTDWIYDTDSWFASTPSEHNSTDISYTNSGVNSQHQLSFVQLKDFLWATHFLGEVKKTNTYSTASSKTRANRQSEAKKIILHILKILAPNGADADMLLQDIIDQESEPCAENRYVILTIDGQ
jgi:hypothetical protein